MKHSYLLEDAAAASPTVSNYRVKTVKEKVNARVSYENQDAHADICRCYNGGNVIQTGGIISQLSTTTTRTNRETVSPYKRKKSEQFIKDEGADIKTGPWKEMETLCLVVCKQLLHTNHNSANKVSLQNMYNFVVKCNAIKNVCLPFSNEKSTGQVAAKILHLNR